MLPEILEPDATGEVAATYARIKHVQATTVVNFIWRHLATVEGGLTWAWPAVEQALPAIQAATARNMALADSLVERHDLAGQMDLRLDPPGAIDVVRVYNRGNCFNMMAMTTLAAMRQGTPAPVATNNVVGPAEATAPVPPLPRFDALGKDEQSLVQHLADSGPAAASGVRPSLWVHLALWPRLLRHLADACIPVLSSTPFHDAHAALRDGAVPLLGLPTIGQEPTCNLIDVAIARFRQRIPEMLLVGRAMLRSARH